VEVNVEAENRNLPALNSICLIMHFFKYDTYYIHISYPFALKIKCYTPSQSKFMVHVLYSALAI